MGDRLLIIGWDGADWEIVDDLIHRGVLPNVAEMRRSGASGTLASTIPSHSWSAWPTFLTGMHPAGHGVFDFVERDPRDPERRVPITSSSIRARTFLEVLSTAGREVRAANIPVTYPPIAVRGRFVSGPVVPPGGRYVHPPEWQRVLDERAPFPPNGLEWQRYRSSPEDLVAEAERLVEQRTSAYEVLLEGDWDVAVCVYLAPDRLQHPLGSHLLPSHPRFAEDGSTPLADGLRRVFARLDAALATLADAAGSDATVVLMSDHGFRPVERVIDANALLEHLGFASESAMGKTVRRSPLIRAVGRSRLGRAAKQHLRAPAEMQWSRTAAYASPSFGGLWVNLRGRERHGVVPPSEFDRVRDQISEALRSFGDPETGSPAIKVVLRREDLPPGPYADLAPDLIAVPSERYAFGHTGSVVTASRWPSGSHRREGILLASGRRARPGALGDRSIADLAATALAFAGVAPPPMDGSTIDEIAGSGRLEEAGAGAPLGREASMTAEDEEFVSQHLRDLGYID